MKELKEAYRKIFGKEPENMADWEVAKNVMDGWNVPLLGEDLAKKVIFKVVNHINFPSEEITREIVLKAENVATELFSELKTDEPHMADIEVLEAEYYKKEKKDEPKGPKIV